MSAPLSDPYGLGVDIALLGDLEPVWGLVGGFTNLGYALARAFNAALGSLFYDLGYGAQTTLTDLIHAGLTSADLSRIGQGFRGVALRDPRVQACRVALSLAFDTSTLTVNVTGTIPQGVPFKFVMAATSVNVALLSVNGVAASVNGATSSAPATAAPSGSGTTVVIQGGGDPGPAGPPGPPGSAQATFNLNPNGYENDSGAETVVDQIDVNMGALAAGVTIELVASVLSQSGTATVRLRLGGSDGVADGTVVATLNATASSFVEANNSTTIANPNGLQRMKLTIQSSAAGQNAQVDRGATITLR